MEIDEDWEDVLGNGDLMRKVALKGNGGRPVKGDVVVIRINGEIHPKFVLGYGFVADALEITVPLMLKGEVCLVRAAPRFCEKQGNAYECEITLEEVESSDNIAEVDKIHAAKIRGNELFGQSEYERAILLYNYGLQLIETTGIFAHDMEIYSAFISNKCAALWKVNDYKKIIEITNDFIALDLSSVSVQIMWKILIRRAESFMAMKKFEEVEDTLAIGFGKLPENKYARLIATNASFQCKRENEKLQNTYKRMIKDIREEKDIVYAIPKTAKLIAITLLVVFISYVMAMLIQRYH